MTQKSLFVFALSLALGTSALSAHAASTAVSGANPRPQAVSGANPRPQAVSGANPRPQADSNAVASSPDVSVWAVLMTALGL
ncbi:hypothetical protein Terro_2932 [Terriglobus roseus DSM 18391]|uniref:Uncharacterized protein n=1 Tax=Terriglobus roseus (strain DSM 18391 / NRRL B-41598 / KBS 63) TaxID=926566 RepID=I3ZIU9_TERRK|nr:hypothetical protein [Terriglobus roseus]AFL89167.1 hypothetical protein Terro_2932 [Terriglobus roseus DSM 18391]